jgi:capsid protein
MAQKRYRPKQTSLTRVNEPSLMPQASVGSFPGTDWSLARGFVYFPELDSEREVDSWSRTELMKRQRAMYNGIGFVRGTITCIARMVCGTGLMPQAMTSAPSWNDKTIRKFNAWANSRNTFHLARKYSFPSSQRAVVRGWMKDGDAFGVLARTEANALRIGLYEGNQVGTGAAAGPGWVDGALLDRHRGALAYRILSNRDGKQAHVDVPAENVLHVVDYERIGQVRGLGCLYHAVNRLLDRGEILAATTKGIKLSQQIGYAIESELGASGPAGGPGALAPGRPTAKVETPSGKITLEKFLESGQVEELAAGKKFRIIHDERPHPNITAHLDGLVRDVALGAGYFPEVLYNAVGLSASATRFVMAGTQTRNEELQETLAETYCGPIYIAKVADMIRTGEIEFHPEWWMHGWLPPARMTVDFGRDGKLHIEQYKQGMITLRTLYGYRGEDWKAEVTDYLNEREFMKKEADRRGLTMAEAFPNFYGMNVGAQTNESAGEDEDPDEEPDEDEDPDEK